MFDWLVGFTYDLSTLVDYLMPNPIYTYTSDFKRDRAHLFAHSSVVSIIAI